MSKLTLNDMSSSYRSAAKFDENFAAIEAAIENTLSRDGTSPNQMEASLDMNSNRVINAATPIGDSDLATKAYVDSVSGAGSTPGDLLAVNNLSDLENASTARTNLGLEDGATSTIGVDLQAYDSNLTSFVGVFALPTSDGTSNQVLRTDGAGNLTWYTIPSGGDLVSTNNLSDLQDANTSRSNLGVSIGTHVLAYDANLQGFVTAFTLPTSDGTANQVLQTDGAGTLSFVDSSSATTSENLNHTSNFTGSGAVDLRTLLNIRGVHVEEFGAVGDGSTDDSASIQEAIDAMEGRGGGEVWFGPKTYKINTGLVVNDAVKLVGTGFGNATTSASQPDTPASQLICGAASNIDMVTFISATSNERLWNAGVIGLGLLGNNAATRGIKASSTYQLDIDCWVERCTVAGLEFDDANGVLSAFNNVNRYQYTAGSNSACRNSHGIYMETLSTAYSGLTNFYMGHVYCNTHSSYIGHIENSSGDAVFHGGAARKTLTSVASGPVFTSNNHGLSVSDQIVIGGTTNYNGTWTVATVPDSNTFTLTGATYTAETFSGAYLYYGDHGYQDGDEVTLYECASHQGAIRKIVHSRTSTTFKLYQSGSSGSSVSYVADDTGHVSGGFGMWVGDIDSMYCARFQTASTVSGGTGSLYFAPNRRDDTVTLSSVAAGPVFTTGSDHDFAVGEVVTIAGTTNYDGSYVIATTPASTTFTLSDSHVDTAPTYTAESFSGATVGVLKREARKNTFAHVGSEVIAAAGSINTILNLNSEPSSVRLTSDAVVQYEAINRKTGARYRTPTYTMGTLLPLDIGAAFLPSSGGATYGQMTASTVAAPMLNFSDTADNEALWTISPPYDWPTGTITEVILHYSSETSVSSKDFVFDIDIDTPPESGGFTAWDVSSAGNVVPESAANGKYEKATISVSAAYTKRDLIVLRVKRDQGHASDTAAKDFYLLGVEIRFLANGPIETGKVFNTPPLNNDGTDNSGTVVW